MVVKQEVPQHPLFKMWCFYLEGLLYGGWGHLVGSFSVFYWFNPDEIINGHKMTVCWPLWSLCGPELAPQGPCSLGEPEAK